LLALRVDDDVLVDDDDLEFDGTRPTPTTAMR
jgi:hypothetical protein